MNYTQSAVHRHNKSAYSRARARIVGRCSPHQGNSKADLKRVKTLPLFTELSVH